MHISANVLRKYISCPRENTELRHLLDDVGIEVKKVENDIFTVELLANRGDHYCYAGIAREISGRLGGAICLPEYSDLRVGTDGPDISVETDLCFLCSCLAAACLRKCGDRMPCSISHLHSRVSAFDQKL